MENRVAIISVIIEKPESATEIQSLLSSCADYIIGRMGIPYREKNLRIITVAIDAPLNVINGLTGKLGRLDGVVAKATYANI